MRYRYMGRLIATAVILIVWLFILYPIPAIITSIVLIAGYIILSRTRENTILDRGQTLRRQEALKTAKIYLAPYKDIWRNLKLSNKYCTLKLGIDGLTITAKEKTRTRGAYRMFRVVTSQVHPIQDLWDMFCISFNHNTTFDGLIDDCRLYRVIISEEWIGTPEPRNITQEQTKEIKNESKPLLKPVDKIDINNASEVELTELPGISIVLAKKIVKERTEIGGFQNINDFFYFLRLKPHMEKQLRGLVCVNKMKLPKIIRKYNERNVDL